MFKIHLSTSSPLSLHSFGRCQCKAGAMGPKCAECQEGYSKFNKSTCEPCRCNNHSKNCNPETGKARAGGAEGIRSQKGREGVSLSLGVFVDHYFIIHHVKKVHA